MSRDKVSKPGVSARNPNRLKVRTGLKSCGIDWGQHNRRLLRLRGAVAAVLRMFADPVRRSVRGAGPSLSVDDGELS